jgi:hypothetical protein
MLLITDDLARRLEMAEAVDAAGCAEAQCRFDRGCDSAVQPIAGGIAVFCGSTSPLTHALCMGMHGPVTPADMEEVEDFFRSRGASVIVDVCPHADPSLRELVSQRGYRMVEYLNVMVRDTAGEIPAIPNPVTEIRRAEANDIDAYVRTVIGGFFGREYLNPDEIRLGTTLFHMPCTTAYLGWIGGEPAGGGGISVRNRVASLFGDATLPQFRGKGVHAATIRARVVQAAADACDVITAGTVPGSASQRNYQRLGFQVAYTKTTMVLE